MKKLMALNLFIAIVTFSFLHFKSDQIETNTLDDFIKFKIEKKKERANLKNDKPDQAMLWYYQQRAYPNNEIPVNWREEATREINDSNLKKTLGTNALTWSQLGPGNFGGRIRAIAVHPTDPNTVYIGAVAGGVWKTIDGGNSWTSITDFMGNIAVCALVIDPNNPNTIYAGTGEGFFNIDAIRGAGIFKSTDAGSSWFQLSTTNNADYYYVNDLEFDAVNGVLYAATRKGLYSSNNGGTSFAAKITAGGADAHCMDVEIANTNPKTIYATFGLFNESQIWRSVDAGSSFLLNNAYTGHGRIEMAISKSNPLIAYASYMDLSTYGTGILDYTSDGGNNWSAITIPGPSLSGATTYTGSQGWYDNIISVDPDNPNVVLAGGIDNFKSTNGGSSWTQKTNWYTGTAYQYVHADQHAIAWAPSNSNIVYLGNDGGIWKSTNKGENWTSLNNNLYITQFYYGATNPSGTVYAGGTQDNGTLRTTGSTSWTEILGGDGGATEIDFNNTNTIYMEYVNLAFYKSTNGGASFFKAMSGIPTGSGFYDGTTDRTQFISPFSMDPNNSNTIVAGTYRVWRTTDGAANWTAVSGDLTGDGTGGTGATISTVIVAKGNSSVIYAGCSNGRVQVTTNAGVSWSLRTTGLPNLSVTKIATDPNNPAIAFVTFSGYTTAAKIYKTTDYGVSWTNSSGNLPNLPTNCVAINPSNGNNLFVGTDLGVFSTTDGGSSWVQDVNGMANVPVVDLDYRTSDNKLFAATHGRSMYSTQIVTSVAEVGSEIPTQFQLTNNYPNPFNPSTKFRYALPEGRNVRIIVYDIDGSKVTELVNNYQGAGTYEVSWNGKNDSGQQVASGTYIYQVSAGEFVQTKKMVMLK
jgi:photosystem II stability/assembly factor-like uncharacterized protein